MHDNTGPGRVIHLAAPNNLLLCNRGVGPHSLSGAQVRWRKAASCTPKCTLHNHAECCIHLINWRHPFISPTDPSLTAHPNRQLCYSDIGSLKIKTTDPADASPVLNDHTSWLVRISESSNCRSNSEAPCGAAKCGCKWKRSQNSEVFLQRKKKMKKKWEHFVT